MMRGSSGCRIVCLPARASWPVILARPRATTRSDAALDAAHAGPGLDLDGVGVHGGAAVARRDVDVLGLVVGDDEAVPRGVNLDSARQLARGRAGRDAIALVAEVIE